MAVSVMLAGAVNGPAGVLSVTVGAWLALTVIVAALLAVVAGAPVVVVPFPPLSVALALS